MRAGSTYGRCHCSVGRVWCSPCLHGNVLHCSVAHHSAATHVCLGGAGRAEEPAVGQHAVLHALPNQDRCALSIRGQPHDERVLRVLRPSPRYESTQSTHVRAASVSMWRSTHSLCTKARHGTGTAWQGTARHGKLVVDDCSDSVASISADALAAAAADRWRCAVGRADARR